MRFFYTFSILMCLFLQIGNTQSLTLVQDLNEGNGDAFDEFNYKSVQLGNEIYFSAGNGTAGFEPYVLKNGSLELLSDIAVGTESSSPTEFILFNNKVYFTAYDTVNGGALWSTDGTSAGTLLAFDPPGNSMLRPKGLTVAKNGALYFSYDNKLYKSFGTAATTNIVLGGEAVDLSENWVYASLTYAPYEDGIAFLSKDDKILKLWYAEDSIVQLGQLVCDSYFFDYYGLNQVKDGLVFGATSPFDPTFQALYHYSPTGDTLHKLPVNGMLDTGVSRVFRLDKDRVIVLVWNSGFVSVDGTGTNDQVLTGNSPDIGQGSELHYTIVGDGDWAVFHENDGFLSHTIAATNGLASGTSIIANPQTAFTSNFVTYGNFALWASGIYNGFKPEIWYADPYHATSGILYQHPEDSTNLNSIIMLGVQDNKLYFFGNEATGLGSELYYLPLNLTPTSERKNLEGYSITNKGREILVSTPDPNLDVDVQVYDASGRLIAIRTVQSNTSFSLDGVNGIFFIEARAGNLRFANRVFVGN